MMNLTGRMALAAALAVAIPMTAAAQQDPRAKHGAAPHAAPARPAAPAARPAAPQMAPRAAPHVAAPRAAPPQVARPQVARPQAPRPQMSAPHVARPSAPNVPRQNFAAPQRHQAPAAVNRNVQQQRRVQQERHIQQRQLRTERQRAPAAQAKPNVPNAQSKTNVQTQRQQQLNTQQQLRAERALQRREDRERRRLPDAQAKTNVQTQPQQQLNTQQQLRAERALQRREDRELRRLPAAQRAQRREEIRNARQQRALTRQQLVQPNAAQSNVRAQRANRRNGVARVTPDAARRGRFASAFAAQNAGFGRDRFNGRGQFANLAAHRAWRHGHRAVFVAWFGPVFWPYAYSDVFDYTFWPAGYDDGYWAYAYDDFFDGVFWGEAGPPADYAYAVPYPRSSSGSGSASRPSYAAVRDLCTSPGSGVTAWPFADIERKVRLNGEQKELLADIRKASQDAAAVFKASCPPSDTFPLTPPGRLDAMTARLEATLQAVQTVRPALEAFYASLSDEQKERFNELGPKQTAANAEAREVPEAADSCKQPKPGLANLPIEKIEDVVNPTDAQETELRRLQDATDKAVEILQAACPDGTPLTPPGRLDAMEKRLQSMIDAAKTVKPALASFYSSLSGEQKARFNRIGQQLSANN